MARLNAPPTAGDSKQNSHRTDPKPQDKPHQTPHKGWPFAEGSQNHLDETTALWPRPSSKPASGVPLKPPE